MLEIAPVDRSGGPLAGLDLAPEDLATAAAVFESLAPATRRAYAGAWRRWDAWALTHGVDLYGGRRTLDLALRDYIVLACRRGAWIHACDCTETTGDPLCAGARRACPLRRWRAARDRPPRPTSAATAALALAAIRWRHEILDLGDPAGPAARAALKAFREDADAPRAGQAAGLRWRDADLAAHLAADDGTLHGLRDAALLRLASDCLLRVSELAAVTAPDLAPAEDGSLRLTIRRSKTDREGRGATVYAGRPTATAIARWRAAADVNDGPLFRRLGRCHAKGHPRYWLASPAWDDAGEPVGGRVRGAPVFEAGLSHFRIGRIVAARAAAAGVAGRITSHSLRIGAAQSLASAGAGLPEMQTAGRWESPAMPAHYAAGELAGRGAVARLRYGAETADPRQTHIED